MLKNSYKKEISILKRKLDLKNYENTIYRLTRIPTESSEVHLACFGRTEALK